MLNKKVVIFQLYFHKLLSQRTPMRCPGVFIVNFEHASHFFSSVSIVDFEQVNVRNVSAIVPVFLLLTMNIFHAFFYEYICFKPLTPGVLCLSVYDTQRPFNVDTTWYDVVRRRIDVETMSCVYGVSMYDLLVNSRC